MRIRTLAAGGALLALLLPVLPATAVPTEAETAVDADEFVVAFDAADEAAALAAVAAAGGTVVDVNEEAGLALVATEDDAFLDTVRADAAVTGAAANHAVGTSLPGMPHRFAEERPEVQDSQTANVAGGQDRPGGGRHGQGTDPLAAQQWDMAMIGATPDGAWRRATGDRVTVGVIDTGVDASHPDIAPNFSNRLSRNFTTDIPVVDGPCEVATCVDPADVDDGGHGTHVAGTIAAARNGIGITGVAPEATIVNLRAGQDSGYFFLYETVAALTYAGQARIDVVNMSFYTDPWLYYCDSPDDYVSGSVTAEDLAAQALARTAITEALEYAHMRGVTLVGSAGNGFTNLALATRPDASSPDFPPDTATERVVTSDCLDLPAEGPNVLTVSAVGPSGTKADYSNYGLAGNELSGVGGRIELAAPGGWFRDFIGTPAFRTNANLILSTYPLHVAIADGLADPTGQPTTDASFVSCDRRGENCGFYTYLQGTSMASPHVAGVAALVVDEHGRRNRGGQSLNPDRVGRILMATATDHACPAGGIEIYTDEGRPAAYNAVCEGSTDDNGLYGEGIVNATAAVAKRR